MDRRPIGIFDSGLGGLTAVSELMKLMHGEQIIYLGDSANMPYGEKTHEQIVEMSRRDMEFLVSLGVKVIFIACGTATSNALQVLKKESPVPVFGVVDASIKEALEATRNGRIGLLATRASVTAGTFENMLKERKPNILVSAKACPRFATMVEDGIFEKDDERVVAAAEEYLPCLKEADVDTVILGCTHYPLLADVISEYMGESVELISSGAAAARELAKYLCENSMENDLSNGKIEFFTTGNSTSFAEKASRMISRDISSKLTRIEPFDKA